jgi:hypothetical protein
MQSDIGPTNERRPLVAFFCRHLNDSTLGTWIVARIAWLAVFCLLGLGSFAFVKVVTGTSAPTVAADIVDTALPPVTANLQDSLAKADRLPVFHKTEPKQADLSLAAIAPADAEPHTLEDHPSKIVARHWHEGDGRSTINRKPRCRPVGRDTTTASSAHANGR